VPFGTAVLAGAFLVYALPADPVWHLIYGVDISAWSLPHMVLLVMVILMSYCSVLVMRTDLSRQWALLRFDLETLWVVLASAAMLIPCLIVMTVDWYAVSTPGLVNTIGGRADWMLPSIITFLTVFAGVTTLRASKTVGSATAAGILALIVRMALDNVLVSVLNGTTVMWTALPILVALDVVYGISILRTRKVPSLVVTTAVVGVAVLVAMLPVMATQFIYPQLSAGNIPVIVLMSVLAAAVAGWLGQIGGDFLGNAGISASTEQAPIRTVWMDAAVYAGFAAFMVFFMVTATPPILG
jgi:hypothetical protein